MDGGWSKGENTEFVCKTLGLKSRSKWKDFYTRNVSFEWTRTTMKPWSSSMNLSWWGDVSNEMEGGKREVSHAPCCTWWRWTPCQLIDFALVNTVNTSAMVKITFLQPPTTYPTICLAFFISSWRVHLDLQTLTCLFFSLAFSFVFLSTSTLISSKVPD